MKLYRSTTTTYSQYTAVQGAHTYKTNLEFVSHECIAHFETRDLPIRSTVYGSDTSHFVSISRRIWKNSESVQDDWLANPDSACSRLICLVKFEVQMNILFIFQSEDSRARQMVTQVLPILFDYRV